MGEGGVWGCGGAVVRWNIREGEDECVRPVMMDGHRLRGS